MGRKLDLSALDDLFVKGEDFELTDLQYERRIGKPLPKSAHYIKSGSPLARAAFEHGFTIVNVVDQPIIARTVILKKKKLKGV